MCEQRIEEDADYCQNVEAMRDVVAGKTAPASLTLSCHVCTNGVCGSDCVGMSDLDGHVAAMKPYSSAPNIDLLCHTETRLLMRPNEAEDVLRLQAVRPVSEKCCADKQQGQSIPEIVVCRYDENGSMVEVCAHVHEPDIVQSTKSSSLPRQGVVLPPQPVAPPRKKKTKTPSRSTAAVANEVYIAAAVFNYTIKYAQAAWAVSLFFSQSVSQWNA